MEWRLAQPPPSDPLVQQELMRTLLALPLGVASLGVAEEPLQRGRSFTDARGTSTPGARPQIAPLARAQAM